MQNVMTKDEFSKSVLNKDKHDYLYTASDYASLDDLYLDLDLLIDDSNLYIDRAIAKQGYCFDTLSNNEIQEAREAAYEMIYRNINRAVAIA